MNSNIVFKLINNTITISEIKREVDYKSLNNTNVINVKELKFSTEYIYENFDLVSSFLSVVLLKKNINIAIINNMDIAPIVMDLINTWDHIDTLVFKPDKKVTFDIFLKILDNKNLKKVECFEMTDYLIERLDINKNLKVKTRNKLTKVSKFNSINMLKSYSDIYYKKVLVLSNEFDNNEIDDLKSFININAKLKVIKIVNYSNELLTTLIEELKINNKKNIVIEIFEKENDLNAIFNSVNYMKKKYKSFFDKNKIKFKLNYSSDYKKNNFFKEVNFRMLVYLILCIIVLSLIIVGINYYQQARDEQKYDQTMDNINELIMQATNPTITISTTSIPNIPVEPTTTTKPIDPIYYTNFDRLFDSLLKLNKDTVGWLTVNNTQINYPVLQNKSRNNYYLWKDFNKKKNSYGWIFMDYRNDPVNLDQNTIIYGHNVPSGIMFGTLSQTFKSSWYNNKSNLDITFNTINKNMKWHVFSFYRIPATEDYLQTNFDTDEEFMNFINLIKGRSKHNFNYEIKPTDKILTLQTCSSNDTRNVLHAVLISSEDA